MDCIRLLTKMAVLLCVFGPRASGAVQTPPSALEAGQSIYVVAIKTSSRVEFARWNASFGDVSHLFCGKEVNVQKGAGPGIDGHRGRRFVPESAILERSTIGQTPVISTDPLLRSEIEKALKKEKKFKVAPTVGNADLVLVAFSKYPVGLLRMQGTEIIKAWRGYDDSPYSTDATAVLAFVLSVSAYRKTGTRQLSDVALWQGYTDATNLACQRSAQADAATGLVKKFHQVLRNKHKVQSQPKLQPQPAPDTVGRAPILKTTPDTPAPRPLPLTPAKDAAVRVATTAVIVPVSVSDRAGLHVPNLVASDFRLFENDVEQKIDHFRPVETPFSVVVLLDSSGSMLLKNEDLFRAAKAFVDELPAQDRVMVASFDSDVRVQAESTADRAQLYGAISGMQIGSGTRLYDAVDLVLTERLRHVDGRKAVVLFTDGVDTESCLADRQRTLDLAEESGALIYSISYVTAEDVAERPVRSRVNGRDIDLRTDLPNAANVSPDAYPLAGEYLRQLTEATGAREYQASTVADLSRAFSLIAAELGRQYEIAYYPTSPRQDGSYRRITVQVNRADVTVRARPGYRLPQQAAIP